MSISRIEKINRWLVLGICANWAVLVLGYLYYSDVPSDSELGYVEKFFMLITGFALLGVVFSTLASPGIIYYCCRELVRGKSGLIDVICLVLSVLHFFAGMKLMSFWGQIA